jgi:hypothetical protein
MKTTLIIALVKLVVKVAQLWLDKQPTVAPFELDPKEGAIVEKVNALCSEIDELK